MTEPVSTTIGGFAAWKAFGMTIVVAICVMAVAAVVLMMRMPREWGVGLITTVISSLAGGSFIIIKFNLHAWATDVWGMIALGGFFFTCGLPGWAIVRWIFNYIEKKEDSDIFEVATDIKNDLKEFKD
ncbi:hypothetical protein ACLDW2_15630 [Acinetobacter baumannii]